MSTIDDPKAHREFKNRLYGQLARLGKALASPHRVEFLELLAQSERTVESHVRSIMGKLNYSSRSQIAVWAAQFGLSDQGAP